MGIELPDGISKLPDDWEPPTLPDHEWHATSDSRTGHGITPTGFYVSIAYRGDTDTWDMAVKARGYMAISELTALDFFDGNEEEKLRELVITLRDFLGKEGLL